MMQNPGAKAPGISFVSLGTAGAVPLTRLLIVP